MPFWSWSKTAASNATADATINWAEGQPPSSVNDSARAMMARLAEYRDDQSGIGIITTGSGTAYAATTAQGFDSFAHLDGKKISILVNATSGMNPTLNVDGLGPKPITFNGTTPIPPGTLVLFTSYDLLYQNANNAFIVKGLFGVPNAIPIGGLMPYVGSAAPNASFALPFGQAISRVTYATLFSLTGTTFGAGDGSTTFNILDLRGRFIAGLDNMGGSAANRITTGGSGINGAVIGVTGGAQNHTLTIAEMPSHDHGFVDGNHHHGLSAEFRDDFAVTTGGSAASINTTQGGSTKVTDASSSNISFSAQGGGTAHPIMPPMIILPYLLRVI